MLKGIVVLWTTVYALFLCSGCATVLVTGVSGGVAYTVTSVAYKTVNFPVTKVETATHKALKKMGIKKTDRQATDDGVEISAEAAGLKISIDLERVTPQCTKISVDAKKYLVVKDKATATAIIEETVKILDGTSARGWKRAVQESVVHSTQS